jgi:CheY-like chemotaxis protein
MPDPVRQFGDMAKSLAGNPLGIIALFIVLVYGFAALVTSTTSFSGNERIPLIYFLVFFPVLVLGVFAWLVSRHSNKLFAPSDFRDEENYVKMQTVAHLTVAASKTPEGISDAGITRIVESVEVVPPPIRANDGRRQILWVDDRPENNINERQAFENVGIEFTLALSTNEALEHLSKQKFSAIISDMGRREGPREGYVLLDTLRQSGDRTPLFFYAASSLPEHRRETAEHGGQGCTSNPQELFSMVMNSARSRSRPS